MRKVQKRILATALALVTAFSISNPFTVMKAQAAAPVPGSIAVGIDVSVHNGPVNWQAVKADGITFAFIRIGNTLKGIDALFQQNMQGAAAAGIRTGVYIYSYATTPEEAAAEANMVLANLGNSTVSFPIVIDMESNPQKAKSRQELTNVANTFCSIIESAGYYPMVYASKNWFKDRMNPIAYDKWVAQYGAVCEDGSRSVWQASNTGRISGVKGNTDINYLYKDYFSMIISDGLVNRNGATYLYKNYRMQTGWQEFSGNRYYLGPDGKMQTGWIQVDDTGRHYMHPTGEMARSFTQIDGATYYFNPEGVIQTGFVDTEAGRHFFDVEGKMQTGFISDGTNMYYFNPAMTVGLAEIDKNIYYFDEKGIMRTGVVDVAGTKFFFNAEGKRQVGWIDDGINRQYYQPETGALVANTMSIIENKVYYFDANGNVQRGIFQVGNVTYGSDASGAIIMNQLLQIGDVWYYFGADGAMAKNTQVEVAGTIYQFDKDGKMIAAVPAVPQAAPVQAPAQ